MAINILSIPAILLDSEQAFSMAKIILTDRYNKLLMEIIKYLEYLKLWLKKEE
jgi:hypothetical protein